MPAWNVRVACSLRSVSTGSGSPVSTCAEISGSTSSRQAKFSMNWLGSSTASHGTPLMPATLGIVDARQHVVQAVAELVEQRQHFVVREQRRPVAPPAA